MQTVLLIEAGKHIVATTPDEEALPEDTDDFGNWEDREAAKKINAIFANRVFVQPLGDGMLRVNFGEVLDEEPSYHSAIVLSARNAILFAELVYKMASAVLAPPPLVRTNVNAQSPEEEPGADG